MAYKTWFIFRGDHHLGPFDVEQLLHKFHSGEINQDTMLWKEGESHWIPFKNQEELQKALALGLGIENLPDLPDLPFADTSENTNVVQQTKAEPSESLPSLPDLDDHEEEMPPPLPPLPTEEVEEEIEEEIEEEVEEEIEEEIEEEVEEEIQQIAPDLEEEAADFEAPVEAPVESEIFNPEEQVKNWQRYVVMGTAIMGLLLTLFYINQGASSPPVLTGLSGFHKKTLHNVTKLSRRRGIRFRLAPTEKGNSLWMSSNIKGPAVVYLSMRSIGKRVLGKEEVVVSSEAELKNHYAHFSNLKLERGEKLVAGDYMVEIQGYETGTGARLLRWLSSLGTFKDFQFVSRASHKFKEKTTFLYYSGTEEQFNKMLSAFKERIERERIRPLKDRLERYRTFHTLLVKVVDLWEDSIERINKGVSMRDFEDKYNRQIGPILREVILDNNRLHISLLNQSPEESREYEKLMNYGKDIGFLASEMVRKTGKYKHLSKTVKERLKSDFEEEIAKLRGTYQAALKAINADIKAYSRLTQ